jgi:hypothetical protein
MTAVRRWWPRIESREARSITDPAGREDVTGACVCRLLPPTCLGPDGVKAILDGRHPKGLKLAALLRGMPLWWEEQKRVMC